MRDPDAPPHDCREHIRYREHLATEPHGERHTDSWWKCAVCGAEFTLKEYDELCARN